MIRNPKRRRAVILLSALLALTAATYFSYLGWIETLLLRALATKGLHDVQFTVESAGLRRAVLTDIAVGGDNPLKLARATLAFNPQDLWSQKLEDVTLEDLSFDAHLVDGKIAFPGMASGGGGGFALPITAQDMARIPFSTLELRNCRITLKSEALSLALPFNLHFEQNPASLTLESAGTEGRVGHVPWRTAALRVNLALDTEAKAWRGTLSADNLSAENTPLPMPATLSGTLHADAKAFKADGVMTHAGKEWSAQLRLDGSFDEDALWVASISDARMAWGGGHIGVPQAKMALGRDQPVSITVQARKVELQSVLERVFEGKLTATGTLSGEIPVTLQGRKITVKDGALTADSAGTLRMDPATMPQQVSELAVLRDVLQDFHYSRLAIAAASDAEGKLKLTLQLEGNNPAAYGGRPVKLNINLGGDVLSLLQQSLLMMNDPGSLLQKAP